MIPWIEKNNPEISTEINNRIKMASNITKDEINVANKFRKDLISEVNISLPKGNIAIFPTTPFSAPLCFQDYYALLHDCLRRLRSDPQAVELVP